MIIVSCQCCSSRYRVSVLSTRCGGYHHKALIVASSYKKANNIHSNNKKNFHQHNFYMPVPILFLNKFNKKISLISIFFPSSYPRKKSINCITLVHWQNFDIYLKKLSEYVANYLQTQFKGNFQEMMIFQTLCNFTMEILTDLSFENQTQP